jgi:hypothetical protein
MRKINVKKVIKFIEVNAYGVAAKKPRGGGDNVKASRFFG